jgi:nitric oxide reductase NorD protein
MSQRKLFAHELEARLDDLLLLSLRQRSAKAPAAQLEALPRELQERVLHWAAVAAQTSDDLGWLIASLAAAQAADLGDEFDDWVRAGLDAYDRSGLAATRKALNDYAEACRSRAKHSAHGIAFAAIEGAPVALSPCPRRRPLKLATGPQAWTDSETLWLPERLDADAGCRRQPRPVQGHGGIVVGADAFRAASTSIPSPSWPCGPTAKRRCAGSPSSRRCASKPAWPRNSPGSPATSPICAAPGRRPLPPMPRNWRGRGATAADSLAALARLREVGAGETPVFPHVGAIDPVAARRVRAARIVRDMAVLRRALNVMAATASKAGAADNPDHPPLAAEGGMQVPDPQADLLALPPAAREAAKSLMQDFGEIPPEALHAAGPGAWQPVDGADEPVTAGVTTQPDAFYDEWDYRRGSWRHGWCHLYEMEGPAGDREWVDEVRTRHAHLIRSIRRRFEALRGEDKPQKRQFDGEEIDLDAQVEARADRKSGGEPSPRLFVHRRRVERSLAVMFMVDMSGSTKGWVNDAERESLVLLCEAIEALGDRYAIYGFSGWTRTHCDIYRIKRFDDRYDAETRRRIAGIEARDYTRMGVAVRHLAGLLMRQNTRHKLLVTLSDGRPDDYGDEYRGRYGIEDTRRALLEAREKGIRSYCVTIDRHGADYLPQLYGPAHYSVIDDAKKLPRKIAEIYRKLTA